MDGRRRAEPVRAESAAPAHHEPPGARVFCEADHLADTVNVAARMLEKSKPNTVAVTEDLWKSVNSDFEGDEVGVLEVKGKGAVAIIGVRSIATPKIVTTEKEPA